MQSGCFRQAYNQMRFQATAMEISNAFRVLDMKDRADEFISNMAGLLIMLKIKKL